MINKTAGHPMELDERRWTPGSYLAAGIALFVFLFFLGDSLRLASWPTDGWIVNIEDRGDPPLIFIAQKILAGPSPLQAGDQLLAINGQSAEQVLNAQHAFFSLPVPDWPDGTRLTYTLLRREQTLDVEVPLRNASYWEYWRVYWGAPASQLVQLLGSLFFFTIGVIVFLLRPGNRAAHALLFIGVGFFFNAVPSNYTAPTLFYPGLPPSIPFGTWTQMINPSLMYLVLAFPYAKAPLRSHPLLTVLLIYMPWLLAFNIAYLLNLESRIGYTNAAFAIYPIQAILMMLVTIISLTHSALKVHDPVGRSQFKWMLAGIGSFVFLGVGGWLASAYLFPDAMSEGNWLTTVIGWFMLPACLGIAILRYRLFDIDVIIRKTLVYGALTALLALVYFGAVTALQGIFTTASGQSAPVVVVISTLGSAALFSPLRRRVQDFIDQRFYRRKYDAEKALAAFAAAARSEMDLAQLSARLTTTVQDTLQPQFTTLWVKPASKSQMPDYSQPGVS